MIGYAICGSFCTHKKSLEVLKELASNFGDILPIISFNAANTDTRFGSAKELIKNVEDICNRKAILTIEDAEPIGPKIKLDIMIISPCTGNTLAKLAHGITDTPVTMAAKAHMRNSRPLLISLASNDALSANLCNIGTLLNKKNIYFTPMLQDDILKKPHSLVANFDLVVTAAAKAIEGEQIRPVFKELSI
ncbi:MAG: dipicolinate synthase subunit B [Ruminococcaceae bacterium]|nr:dipicolinate synthase subunit B [Oscillospiraceae bacterium]